MTTLILCFRGQEGKGHGIIMVVPNLILLESVLFKGSSCGASIMMPRPHPTGSVLWLSYEVSFVSVPSKEHSKIEKFLEGTGSSSKNLSGSSCWSRIQVSTIINVTA